jgi:hypothetical protein
MIGSDGKPLTKAQVQQALTVYNGGNKGSKEYRALPRALVIIFDRLAVGQTTYVKAADGQMQVSRRKDKTVAAT